MPLCLKIVQETPIRSCKASNDFHLQKGHLHHNRHEGELHSYHTFACLGAPLAAFHIPCILEVQPWPTGSDSTREPHMQIRQPLHLDRVDCDLKDRAIPSHHRVQILVHRDDSNKGGLRLPPNPLRVHNDGVLCWHTHSSCCSIALGMHSDLYTP